MPTLPSGNVTGNVLLAAAVVGAAAVGATGAVVAGGNAVSVTGPALGATGVVSTGAAVGAAETGAASAGAAPAPAPAASGATGAAPAPAPAASGVTAPVVAPVVSAAGATVAACSVVRPTSVDGMLPEATPFCNAVLTVAGSTPALANAVSVNVPLSAIPNNSGLVMPTANNAPAATPAHPPGIDDLTKLLMPLRALVSASGAGARLA